MKTIIKCNEKENIDRLHINKLSIENTSLVNAKTGIQQRIIKVRANDGFFVYEIELNQKFELMNVPDTLYMKYNLEEVQEKIKEYLYFN